MASLIEARRVASAAGTALWHTVAVRSKRTALALDRRLIGKAIVRHGTAAVCESIALSVFATLCTVCVHVNVEDSHVAAEGTKILSYVPQASPVVGAERSMWVAVRCCIWEHPIGPLFDWNPCLHISSDL